MTRTPSNASRLMLESGKKIIAKDGCSGLRIREMADRAGVNLGMFHYHFKSKERFKRILLQEVYEEFFAKLSVASKEGKTAYAQLRASLIVMGGFVRDEHELCAAIFRDVLNDDPAVLRFVRENVPRHFVVFRDLVLKCQKEGSIAKVPLHQALSFLISGMNMPTVVGFSLKRRGDMNVCAGKKNYVETVTSIEAITQRIDFALKGLKP
jgi:AcrR family transcriptional regulator